MQDYKHEIPFFNIFSIDTIGENMELTTPKQIQTQETKQRIYRAAMEILQKNGFAYLTVSNICKVAEVSNGTFFYHFKTKDELLIYYVYDQFASFREANKFEDAVKELDYENKILTFYDYWADYICELGLEFSSNFYHTKNYSLDVRRWNQREPVSLWNYPGECLTFAKNKGMLKEGQTVDYCVEILASIVKGVIFDWCLCGGVFDMRPRIREIMCPYLESIRK